MAYRDLALTGTVSRDAGRHVGPGNDFWVSPTLSNDGNSSTYAYISSSLNAFQDYLKIDLGATYRVTLMKILVSNTPTLPNLFQWSTDGTSWTTLSYVETGGRQTSPNGATLTFAAPVDARYFAIRAQASGFHSSCYLPTVQLWGDDLPPPDVAADFSGTPRRGGAPLTVAFTDLSAGTPNTWLWTFGDGATSTLQNPTHEYAEEGAYTVSLVATRSSDSATDTETKVAYIEVVSPSAWDVYAAGAPNGAILATLSNASGRMIRFEEDGAGVGGFTINRHSTEATAAILAKGNLVKVRIPEVSSDYIGGFFLEEGDFDVLSSGEEGAEELRFSGRGVFSYLGRAIMWSSAFSTGLDIADTWTEIWKTSAISNPVGACLLDGDTDYLYVISATTRKIYKLRQSDRVVVASSPALWAGSTKYAAGLCADPSDATILWALEAPVHRGGAGNTKIRKIDVSGAISAWSVSATFDLGSAIQLTDLECSSTHLWTTRLDGTTSLYKRSKSDGSVVSSYTISYLGTTQTGATGSSINGTEVALWYLGKKRALIADLSDPTTILDSISTTGISAYGGAWTTEGGNDYFYPVSSASDVVWKYQITTATPRDPVDGIWRLDEATPGAILARLVAEWLHPDRPQQPIPLLAYVFDFLVDSDGNAWSSHPGTAEFTANIGDVGDATALRLIPYGLTLQMSPYLILEAYNEATFGTDRTSATFAAGKVRVEGGVNAAEGLRRRMDDRKVASHLLLGGDSGLFTTATEDDLGYVREGFLPTNLTDVGALAGTGDAELARQRRDADAQAVVIPWGSDETTGRYLPGPPGTAGHYWLGDTIRVDSGSGEFDLVEADRDIKAITLEELDNGAWNSVVDLASVFLPIYDPVPGKSSSSGSTLAGSNVSTVVASSVTVRDTLNNVLFSGSSIESDDWGVSAPGTGRVAVTIRRRPLGDLLDVEIDGATDGQIIAYDTTTETWILGDLPSASNANPQDDDTVADPGVSPDYSRADHRHVGATGSGLSPAQRAAVNRVANRLYR